MLFFEDGFLKNYKTLPHNKNYSEKGEKAMIHFVGAGSGAPDLITVRGKKYLEEADMKKGWR